MTLNQIAKLLEEEIDPVLNFVREVRPYKIQKGYLRWDVLSAIVAFGLISFEDPMMAKTDAATRFSTYRMALWFVQNAPMYCISNPLLRAFQESDVLNHPDLLADLTPPLPTFILLFPENSIRTPDGSYLNFAVVHLSDRDRPELSKGSAYGISVPYLHHEHKRNLHWSGVDMNETVWFSGMGLEADGTVKFTEESLGADPINAEERQFLRLMRSLVLQVLLTLTYKPDLLEIPAETTPQRPGKRPGKSDRTAAAPMHPRWLGKDYQRTQTAKGKGKGTHGSPKEHWRSGHWRRVAVGKREENQRKWVWIEPVFVQAT